MTDADKLRRPKKIFCLTVGCFTLMFIALPVSFSAEPASPDRDLVQGQFVNPGAQEMISAPAENAPSGTDGPKVSLEEKTVRTLTVKGTKWTGGNTIGYTVPLKHIKIALWETDSGDVIGMSVGGLGNERMEIYTEHGKPGKHTVYLGGTCGYDDLDGDGRIDAMYDGKTNRTLILVDEAWLEVPTYKSGIEKEVKTLDGRKFRLRKGLWTEYK